MMRRIEIHDSDPVWPAMFEAERRRLTDALSRHITGLTFHHIGSTSVPGLAAKPIIDILLEVPNVSVLDDHCDRFESLGYTCRGEYGIPGRRYFQRGGDNRTHHLHAFAAGSAGARRHLVFRDYLRAHPAAAARYATVKRAAARACNHDTDAYGDLKHDFVAHHEKLALAWWSGQVTT
ncbi:MAG: GrpB family protein [Erythrobacter sp.]|nr:GrpB family protein [Erythrobacter sp.]